VGDEWCKACGGEIMRDGACRECGLTFREGRDAYYGRMPQSNKEKQEAYRARQAMLGLTEVRGIYLPPDLHQKLKDEARRMLAEKIDQAKAKP
jgi:hypothetical protein